MLLGSDYISSQSRAPSTLDALSPSLCAHLSAFHQLLRDSRDLDDAIALRLNRTSALDRANNATTTDRQHTCDHFWSQLVARWTTRGQAIDYCDQLVGRTAAEIGQGQGGMLQVDGLDRDRLNRGRGEDEALVKVRAAEPLSRHSPSRPHPVALTSNPSSASTCSVSTFCGYLRLLPSRPPLLLPLLSRSAG